MRRVPRAGIHERSHKTANGLQIKRLPIRLVPQDPLKQVPKAHPLGVAHVHFGRRLQVDGSCIHHDVVCTNLSVPPIADASLVIVAGIPL